jgi:DNA-binding phage protein
MAYYLEGMFSDNNVMLMLDAINAVARAKGLNQIAIQADSLQGKNPTRDILCQILNNLGFSWEGKTIKPIK